MNELSFLIDLLLNHKLPKPTKQAIADRIKDIEMINRIVDRIGTPPAIKSEWRAAEPSTPPAPITAAATDAMNARNQAIESAMKGKNESIYKAKPK